ncbi:hypothetical protein AB0L53_44390 [Nonomuraea sp. NPDC052129]|uniref:hypothetical protein n=1 Tax=Nonomuraea sp. NPDC052129 TaxID=3154651 RepID=UPI00342386D9
MAHVVASTASATSSAARQVEGGIVRFTAGDTSVDVSIGADDAAGIDYSNQVLHSGTYLANAEQLRCDTRQAPGWLPRPRRSQGESIAKSSPHR